MTTRKIALTVAVALIACAPVAARETTPGQYDNVPDSVRQWFKAQKAPSGVSCCDIGDGFNTEWVIRGDKYFVPVPGYPNDPWVEVPDNTIITGHGNPNGNAVVWWAPALNSEGHPFFVRCFVPGALL